MRRLQIMKKPVFTRLWSYNRVFEARLQLVASRL
uniref:Uncharacterized protein n=1 Tax=Dulem virus 37 TaxID=3145755 RepID=A0AAU8AWY4_9CAUD